MDEEERESLELERCDASSRMKETWITIKAIRKILRQYENDYWKWRRRYERADRQLAEVDGRLKKQGLSERPKKEVEITLTEEQIKRVTELLGIPKDALKFE